MKLWMILLVWYIAINIWSFSAMAYDKSKSKQNTDGKGRVKENSLLIYSLIGGFIGCLIGMYKLRHKTKHASFKITFWGSMVLHLILIGFLLYKNIIVF